MKLLAQLGVNTGGNHWSVLRPGGRQVCVHGFIGRLADGSVAAVQTLPWSFRGWHCGQGTKGKSANDAHIMSGWAIWQTATSPPSAS